MNQWQGVMKDHAKSFYLASLFFPKKLIPRVQALYALCRWLDDAVDEAANEESARLALETISNDLHAPSPTLPVNIIYKENQLDVGYIDDLIQGAKDDLQNVRIQNQEELIQYSYKVAGTVGLAMFDLMAVNPPQARANAVDLGIAMQITNICRDVKEDLHRNRIYLPLDLLKHYQITERDFIEGLYRSDQLACCVRDLLRLADHYYESSQRAFQTIPWRARGAIIIASQLYRGIGVKLLKQGADPMRGRTYLTTTEKIAVVGRSLGLWVLSAFKKPKLTHDSELHKGLEYWKQLRSFNL